MSFEYNTFLDKGRMYIICFDPAIKFLGYVMVKYQTIQKYELDKVKTLDELNTLIDNMFNIVSMDVIDLNVSKSTGLENRTKALKNVLYNIDSTLPKPDIVLIEKQMKKNNITNLISGQIIYHYTNFNHACKSLTKNTQIISGGSFDKVIVKLVSAASKNSVYLHDTLKYQNIIIKGFSLYTTNKKHTETNFKYFCNLYKIDTKFKVKLYDMSDCFMLIVAYLKSN